MKRLDSYSLLGYSSAGEVIACRPFVSKANSREDVVTLIHYYGLGSQLDIISKHVQLETFLNDAVLRTIRTAGCWSLLVAISQNQGYPGSLTVQHPKYCEKY